MNRNPRQPPVDFDLDPLDDPDPFDPTGYYARKAKHREEMLPLLGWMFVAAAILGALGLVWEWLAS